MGRGGTWWDVDFGAWIIVIMIDKYGYWFTEQEDYGGELASWFGAIYISTYGTIIVSGKFILFYSIWLIGRGFFL